jgi:hypothetical protein
MSLGCKSLLQIAEQDEYDRAVAASHTERETDEQGETIFTFQDEENESLKR